MFNSKLIKQKSGMSYLNRKLNKKEYIFACKYIQKELIVGK